MASQTPRAAFRWLGPVGISFAINHLALDPGAVMVAADVGMHVAVHRPWHSQNFSS
ncbi:hypothetical protein J2W36_002444 [Variovorax ginsengisoli]|uniref:Uncharacterized protein n=1 Tax=Variovorax ginsengisoli TaxID=363844 RepID=A0ABT9S8T8_9BURK|nr:hypothetical protein [Variovorax ginsengisoli]